MDEAIRHFGSECHRRLRLRRIACRSSRRREPAFQQWYDYELGRVHLSGVVRAIGQSGQRIAVFLDRLFADLLLRHVGSLPLENIHKNLTRFELKLRIPDQYPRNKHQHSAQADLERRRNPGTIHITMANPGDYAKFHQHDNACSPQRVAKILQKKR